MRQKLIPFFVLILLITILFTYFNNSKAQDINIIYNNENVNEKLDPLEIEGEILVRASSLAEIFDLELRWIHHLNTLELKADEIEIKMMQHSPLMQIGNQTRVTSTGLLDIEGSKYIPFQPLLEGLGFLIEFEVEDKNFKINQPSTVIQEIRWADDKQEIIVEMDELSPYRIKNTAEPEKLVLEIEDAVLSDEFEDNVSDKNFYVRFNRVENETALQMSIVSRYPIPFHRDGNVSEGEGRLKLSFLPTIDNIIWQDNRLQILGNGDLGDPEMFYLDNPQRLVLDFPQVMVTEFEKEALEAPFIDNISVSQFSHDPLIMRVVLEIEEDKYFNRVYNGEKDRLVFQTVEETRLYNLTQDSRSIIFETDREVAPDIFTLQDPARLVVDLFNTERSKGIPDQKAVKNDLVKQIRTSRFQDDRVRIVVDLEDITGFNMIQSSRNGFFQYEIMLSNGVRDIFIEDGDNYTDVQVALEGKARYEIEEHRAGQEIEIIIWGLDDIPEQTQPELKGLVNDIEITQLDDERSSILLHMDDYKDFEVNSIEKDEIISLSFSDREIAAGERVVIIDPGHGGFDPGAVGPSGLTEKEVALDISLKLYDFISDRVDDVVLTRTEDKFISLRERVRMANQKEEGVFVSIHANASTRSNSEGTETFIAPNSGTPSLILARDIHKELVAGIGLTNRGIKRDNFYVIRNTEMPAVLVEVAFLSNPHEESLLSTDRFRQDAAEAIGRGIIKYFEED